MVVGIHTGDGARSQLAGSSSQICNRGQHMHQTAQRLGLHLNCEKHANVTFYYSRTPVIRTMVIRKANYPDKHGPWGTFIHNSTKLTCLEITGYRIKYSTVLWFLELPIGG
jgi:hypothetical protein